MNNLSRRSLLKGVSLGAGATFFSPLLQQIAANAQGIENNLPKRLVIVTKGSGLTSDGIQPQGVPLHDRKSDKNAINDLSALKLHDCMKPLLPFKDKLTILQGISGKGLLGTHNTFFGCLSGYAPERHAVSVSIDAAIAQQSNCIFPHVGLCNHSFKKQPIIFNMCSAWGENKAIPYIGDPSVAYDKYFNYLLGDSVGMKKMQGRKRGLDFLKEDIRTLQKQVSPYEKEKVEHYVKAVEDLELRNKKLSQLDRKMAERVHKKNEQHGTEDIKDILESYFDITASLLLTGLSQVVSVSLDTVESRYPHLSTKEKEYYVHSIGHRSAQEWAIKARSDIRQFHFEMIAGLAEKLRQVPEGNGTMLDNTVILYLSNNGCGHHAGSSTFPCVMINGGWGGRLKGAGKLIQYGQGPNTRQHLGNFYASLLHAAGSPVEHFGNPDYARTKGPLSELL